MHLGEGNGGNRGGRRWEGLEGQEEPGRGVNSAICVSVILIFPCLAQALPLNSGFVCLTSHSPLYFDRGKLLTVNSSQTELGFQHVLVHLSWGTFILPDARVQTLGSLSFHPKSCVSGDPLLHAPTIWPLSPFCPGCCLGAHHMSLFARMREALECSSSFYVCHVIV